MSRHTVGEGKHKVFFERYLLDDDIIFIVGGGQRSHVGGVVICEPEKPMQVLGLFGHRDVEVLRPFALAACEKYQKRVTVLGGIHIDDATQDDIKIVIENCKQLGDHV
jgi:hypothetical protein